MPFNSEKCYTEIVLWVNVITLTLGLILLGPLVKRNTVYIFPVLTKWSLRAHIPSLKRRYIMYKEKGLQIYGLKNVCFPS